MPSWISRKLRGEDGSLSLFAAIAVIGLLAAVAFAVDAGVKMQAASAAQALAEEAARAGAEDINQSAALGQGTFVTDPAGAAAAAQAWLSQAGHTGTVTVTGNHTIQVTVTVSEPAVFAQIFGIHQLAGTGTATATLVQGVTGPQP